MSFVLPLSQAMRDGAVTDPSLLVPLRPFIFGPMAALHRFSNATEKPTISLGAYDPLFDQSYPWPGRSDTSVIDTSYVKLFLTNAYLNYFNDYVSESSTITPVATFDNQIVSNTVKFKSHINRAGTAYPRSTSLLDRDVQVGDIAFVRGTVSAVTYSQWTSVKGFVNDVVAASVGSATSDAANHTDQSEAASISQVAGTPLNDIGAAADGTSYESSIDGYLNRTYTITVTQSSTGSDGTTGRLSVVSLDGGDNQTSVTPAAFGSATDIGTKGLTVTFSELMDATLQANAVTNGYAPDDFVVGQQWTVAVSQVWVAPAGTSAGTYSGATDTKYIVTVTKGGQVPTVDSPTAAPTAGSASSGGSLATGTYYAKYSYVNANGQTIASPVSSSFSTTSGNNTIALTIASLAGAITAGAVSANVYLSTSSGGTFHLYKTAVTTSPTSLTAVYSTATAVPPTTNTCTVTARVGLEPQVTVSTTTGVDTSGPTKVQAKSQAFSIGNYGITLLFNKNILAKGDIYYVVATAADTGAYHTLILNNDLPTGVLTATDLDLRLFIPKTTLSVPLNNSQTGDANWSASESYVSTKAAVTVFDPSWTDDGVEQLLPVTQGNMYAEYREWLTDLADQIIDVFSSTDVTTNFGLIDPDNPIAYAASLAIQNTPGVVLAGDPALNTLGPVANRVRCAILNGKPDATDHQPWIDMLTMIEDVDQLYTLVPLTQDPAVNALIQTHISTQVDASVGLPRAGLFSAKVNTTEAIVNATTTTDTTVALAKIKQDPNTTTTSFTYLYVPAGNAQFVTNGVVAGDIVRYAFTVQSDGSVTWTEYVVDSVVSQDTLKLKVGSSVAVTVAQKVEVWRNYTADQIVTQLTTNASNHDTAYVLYTWPDVLTIGSTAVPGYYLNAALAAIMGSVPSHQGLTNIQILGFDAVPRSTKFFNRAQLNALTAGGVFVVSQTSDGTIYVRRGVTTRLTPLNQFEEVCRRNIDMFSYVNQARFANFYGISNVTQSIIGDIAATLTGTVSSLKHATSTARLGSAIYDAQITSFVQKPGAPDRLQMTIAFVGPYPLNFVELTLTL